LVSVAAALAASGATYVGCARFLHLQELETVRSLLPRRGK
jgi:hypothetical protein